MSPAATARQYPFASALGAMVLVSVAALLLSYVVTPSITSSALAATAFPDLPLATPEGAAAAYLRDREVLTGMPDGLFHGEQMLNRAQAAKLLLLAADRHPDTDRIVFRSSDVEANAWYADHIAIAWYLGIMQGYGNNEFRPAQTIVRAEFYKMLAVAFQFSETTGLSYQDVGSGDWYAPYALVAKRKGLILRDDGKNFLPNRLVNRAEAAYALAKSMQILRNEVSSASVASRSSSSSTMSSRSAQTSSLVSSQISSQASTTSATSRSSVSISSSRSSSSSSRSSANSSLRSSSSSRTSSVQSSVSSRSSSVVTSRSSSVRSSASSVADANPYYLDVSRAKKGNEFMLCRGDGFTHHARLASKGDTVSLQLEVDKSLYRAAVFDRADDAFVRNDMVEKGLAYQRTATSEDGRFVAMALATDTVTGGGQAHLYLLDRVTNTLQLVAENINTLNSDIARVLQPPMFDISGDGKRIVFATPEPISEDDTDDSQYGPVDLYMYDRETGDTSLLINGDFRMVIDIAMSDDGDTVVFAAHRQVNDTLAPWVVDVSERRSFLIPGSVVAPSNGALEVREISVSDDGQFVAFTSGSSYGAYEQPWGGGSFMDIFLFDRRANTVSKINYGVAWRDGSGQTRPQADGDANSFGTAISGNGRYIAYLSLAKNLTGDDLNNNTDQRFHSLYIYDREQKSTAVWDLPKIDDTHIYGGRYTGQRVTLNHDGTVLGTSLLVTDLFQDGTPGNSFGREDALIFDTKSGQVEVLKSADSCQGGQATLYGVIRRK